jgi:hypothetical protein
VYDLFLNGYRNEDLPCTLSPRSPLVKAMRYCPGTGDGETVLDQVELVLEGAPEAISRWMEDVQRRLSQAEREAGLLGGDEVQLWAQITEGDFQRWRSRVLGGRMRLGPAGVEQRPRGAQGLTVEIRRVDGWESDYLRHARLQNEHMTNMNELLLLRNHRDAEHWNSAFQPLQMSGPDDLLGGLPMGAQITWEPVDNPWPRACTLLVGHAYRANINAFKDTYQAEYQFPRIISGVTWSTQADASCAGGQYLQLNWTGCAEVGLIYFDIDWSDVEILAGGPVRLVLRVPDGLSADPAEKLWYRWRVFVVEEANQYLAGESSSQYMETGQELVIGPVMNLPPWQVDTGWDVSLRSLRVELTAQSAGNGAHALKLDTITVMPCDGWRIYRPVSSRPTYGLVENQPRGLVLGTDFSQTHTVEGPGFELLPGQEQRWWLFVLSHEPDGRKTAPLELESTFDIRFYARRRTL